MHGKMRAFTRRVDVLSRRMDADFVLPPMRGTQKTAATESARHGIQQKQASLQAGGEIKWIAGNILVQITGSQSTTNVHYRFLFAT